MIDLADWVTEAVTFARRLDRLPGKVFKETMVAPPTDTESVSLLSTRLRVPIPDCIGHFLTQASANCSFWYRWKSRRLQSRLRVVLPDYYALRGGGGLCDMAAFAEQQQGCVDWAWSAVEFSNADPQAVSPWRRAFPFFHVGNGDMLALDVASRIGRHPVVYLDHDYPSDVRVVAETFEHFLKEWQQICYFSPDCWGPFVDPNSGYIDGTCQKAQELRNLFADLAND